MTTSQLLYSNENGWQNASKNEVKNPQLILLFGNGDYFKTSSYGDLKKLYPQSNILGCSTAGSIIGQRVDDITVATLVSFDQGRIKIVSADFDTAEESMPTAKKLAQELNSEDLKHVFVLSDGLNVNGSEIADGFNEVLPEGVLLTGGLAGDGVDFAQTYVVANDVPKSKRVAALGFYGDSLEIKSGCFAGWDEFGAERIITKSKGNILYEIDGKPALELYKSYLGDETKDLPASGLKFPIAIRKDLTQEPLIRTLLAVDEETQSLTFAGDIPEGFHCRLMKSNMDRLIDNAGLAAEQAYSRTKENSLCIAVSCVGRRIILSQLVEEEIDAIEEVIGKESTIAGFYSYGELAPLVGFSECALHNQTMTLTIINEN
ncbi:hypothetical protein GJV85_00630 [Sulfurimonas aquatica]|uniref:Histidine kinase n=1 Tax=Sulfurimonas aquatica TaxID=2672570 RepID=A0A975GBL8_9BACT|nr:FIST N-terminal domain-containing protein [Sulfurimonas aquatica]QSZ40685.1 hypothetical protein GJV85_00630 [Sulfurimonas aquatica]